MGRAGSTVLERIPGGRQALKEIHLEGREDRHILAEGNLIIVPEIQFWPVRKEEGRQQGCRENPGPVPGTSLVKLHSLLPQSWWASANTYWAAPEPLDKEVNQTGPLLALPPG